VRAVACLILGTIAVSCVITGRSAPAAPRPADRPYGGSPGSAGHYAGTSCSAASCHGGPGGRAGGEHTDWAPEVSPHGPYDPHSRAYRVLFDKDSQRMAKYLGLGNAHEAPLCLKCHAVEGAGPAVTEGVGCTACHGPADKWLTTHYMPEWKGLSNRDKFDHYGFVPTKNVVARVLACATCHVGDADREVNHDLIAAGHPRLAFEYTRFHYNPTYRKHWLEKTANPDFEVRAWAVGQAAALRQAVEVLRARAERARDAKAPWPEFAEGSCFACHQSIGSPYPKDGQSPLRGAQGDRRGRPSGAVPWQPWYESLGASVARYHDLLLPGVPGAGKIDLTELRQEMEKPYPSAAKVEGLARKARDDLDAWLAVWQAAEDRGAFPPVSAVRLDELAYFVADGAFASDGRLKDSDWDFVAQRYLGLTAFYHAGVASDARMTAWRDPLVRLRGVLDLPRPLLDLQTGKKSGFDNPVNYQPAAAEALLRKLREIISTP
jgi:hypothetical protein